MFSIEEIREHTAGAGDIIYLNNAGSSLPPVYVMNRIMEHLLLEEKVGGYEAQAVVADEIKEFYNEAAKLINANAHEIAFMESATHGWQRFFYSLPLQKNDTIVLFEHEYASFYIACLQQQKRTGCSIEIIPSTTSGDICLTTLENKLDERVKIVLLGHMPTHSGQISPAEEVGSLVQKKAPNAFYILDGTQTVGQYPVDVKKIKCHALCATGRKFLRGPRGTGFLYVNEDAAQNIEPFMIDLQGAEWVNTHSYKLAAHAQRFETWEQNIASKLGLKEALQYANMLGIESIWQQGNKLARFLREELTKIPTVTVRDIGSKLGNIVTFTVGNEDASTIAQKLRKKNISINFSKRAYAHLDFERRGLDEVCRASPHYFNTEQEIEKTIKEISSIVRTRK